MTKLRIGAEAYSLLEKRAAAEGKTVDQVAEDALRRAADLLGLKVPDK